MIHACLDFLRSLTDPERLIQLLSTLLSGWLGYADAVRGGVFRDRSAGWASFFPAIRCCSRSGWWRARGS